MKIWSVLCDLNTGSSRYHHRPCGGRADDWFQLIEQDEALLEYGKGVRAVRVGGGKVIPPGGGHFNWFLTQVWVIECKDLVSNICLQKVKLRRRRAQAGARVSGPVLIVGAPDSVGIPLLCGGKQSHDLATPSIPEPLATRTSAIASVWKVKYNPKHCPKATLLGLLAVAKGYYRPQRWYIIWARMSVGRGEDNRFILCTWCRYLG